MFKITILFINVCHWYILIYFHCYFQIFIKAFSADNSAKSLLVDERMTVGQVCRLLADKNHVPMDPRWTLVEHIPELFMGRNFYYFLSWFSVLSSSFEDLKNNIMLMHKIIKMLPTFSFFFLQNFSCFSTIPCSKLKSFQYIFFLLLLCNNNEQKLIIFIFTLKKEISRLRGAN